MTKLLFSGPDRTLGRFPKQFELRRLGRGDEANPEPAPMYEFVDAARQANKRLWILDQHFIEYGLHGAQRVLEAAQVEQVRIISEKVDGLEERKRKFRDLMAKAWYADEPDTNIPPAPVGFEWRDRLRRKSYPFAHDRFVIVDDDLWHFGFAACGSSNCLSAASGPWPVASTEAISFYEELWEYCSDA